MRRSWVSKWRRRVDIGVFVEDMLDGCAAMLGYDDTSQENGEGWRRWEYH
jgi:hypothetical protein